MSRTALLALALAGTVIVFTAVIGPNDRSFHPISTPPGMILVVNTQIAAAEPIEPAHGRA